nr:hypothetical protein [Forsythia suspensa dicistrovirus]
MLVFWLWRTLAAHTPSGMAALINSLGLLALAIPSVRHIHEFVRKREEVRVGTPESSVSEQSGVSTTLSMLLSVVLVHQCVKVAGRNPASVVTTLASGLTAIDRLKKIDDFALPFVELLQTSVNAVLGRFGKQVTLVKRNRGSLEKWVDDVERMSKKYSMSETDMSPAEIDRVLALVSDGYQHKKTWRSVPDVDRTVSRLLDRLDSMLLPVRGAISARNNFRVEPLTMGFVGAPGIGKTRLTMAMSAAMLKLAGIVPEDAGVPEVAAQIFQKGTSKFWSGYAGQSVFIMDDAFQTRADVSGEFNDYYTLIRAVSCWSMPLDMADIESKGRVFFNSKVVMLSTNISSIKSESDRVVTCPEAVGRRINNIVRLRLKPDYQNRAGFLDNDKYMAEAEKSLESGGVDAFPWHLWEVCRHDMITGFSDEHNWRPLKDYVVECAKELRRRLNGHQDETAHMEKYLKHFNTVSLNRERMTVDEQSSLLPDDEEDSVEQISERNKIRLLLDQFCAFVSAMRRLTMSITPRDIARLLFMYACVQGVIMTALQLCRLLGGAFNGVFGRRGVCASEHAGEPRNFDNTPVAVEQAGEDVLANKVYRNQYFITMKADGSDRYETLGHALSVTDGLLLFPSHYFEHVERWKAGRNFVVRLQSLANVQLTREVSHDVWNMWSNQAFRYANSDLCAVDAQPYVMCRKNIIHHFVTEKKMAYHSGHDVQLDMARGSELIQSRLLTTAAYHDKPWRYSTADSVKTCARRWEYRGSLLNGDCGAILSVTDVARAGGEVILGMHFASRNDNGSGLATVITREMVLEAKEHFGAIEDCFEQDSSAIEVKLNAGEDADLEGGSFSVLGWTNDTVSAPVQSKLHKNPLTFERFGPNAKRPAVLRPFTNSAGDLIRPMHNALAKVKRPDAFINEKDMTLISHVAFTPLTKMTRDDTRQLLTFEEAVLGVPELAYRGLTRGTSAGYPYVLDANGKGKTDFFGEKQQFDLTTPLALKLRVRVEHILNEARSGRRLRHFYRDFLKDETRKHSKVDAGESRLISSAAVDYVIAWRMMFGTFQSAVFRTRIHNGMAPGINPYREWSVLAEHITKKGDKLFDGDFAAFDASESPVLQRYILDYINAWYDDGPDNARIRAVLWRDLTNSRHIGGIHPVASTIYQWHKGMPSGHPFTTVVNSMYSLMLLVGVYHHVTGSCVNFWDKCSVVTYGDDNIVNVADDAVDKFNQVSVAKHMAELYGCVYTSSDKESGLQPYSSIDKVSFLKRAFVNEGGQWLAPLELDSFLSSTYWTRSRDKYELIARTADDLDVAQRELSLHNEKAWNTHIGVMDAIRKENGLSSMLPSHQKTTRDFVSRMDFPF